VNERNIFEAAIEIDHPNARRSFVTKACARNSELLAKVLALVASYEEMGSFLEDSPDGAEVGEKSRTKKCANDEVEKEEVASDGDFEAILALLTPSTKADSLGALGHYEILRSLGQGGFGTVLMGFDEILHRLVAIKMLSPTLATTSPPRKRFLREARSGAAVNHENIVQVYSVEEQPSPYLVMEFVNGSTLHAKMREEGPFELPEIVNIGRQIASGLAAAHAMGLIHRDIKPGNILLEKGGERKVKITDFGLARAAADASLTRSGMIIGTPLYMAPEQALGVRLDHRADLFSLGSVLYAMSTGHPPFRASSTMAVLHRVAVDTPRPLQDLIPELPDWLVALVNRLLAKNPADRFQSAKEVADLLGRYQGELWATGTAKSLDTPRLSPLHSSSSPPTSADPIPKRPRFRAAYAASLLPFLALGGALLYRSQHTDEDVARSQDVEPAKITKKENPGPSQSARPVTIQVPADQAWTGTDIHVTPGSIADITASGHVEAANDDETRTFFHVVPPYGRNERVSQAPYPDFPSLALLGRVGPEGIPFFVGSKTHFEVSSPGGELFLGINDDIVSDNSGEWTVRVTIKPGQNDKLTTTARDPVVSKLATTSTSPSTSSPTVSSVSADADRELAIWVLGQPGDRYIGIIRDGESKKLPIKRVEELPKERFHLYEVHLRDATEITDDDLARLGRAGALESLQFWSQDGHLSNITDKGLQNLLSPTVCKSLHYLSFYADLPQVTDSGYLVLSKSQELDGMLLHIPPDKGEFLTRLELPKIRDLWLRGSGIPDAACVQIASHMPRLSRLEISRWRPTHAAIQEFAKLDRVDYLILDDSGLDDGHLQELAKMRKITQLFLRDNLAITDVGVAHLAAMTGLVRLDLSQTDVGNGACKTLASLPALEQVSLSQTRVEDGDLEVLSSCKSLKRLFLESCVRISDKGLESLAKIRTLTELHIRDNPELSEAAIRSLKAALPRCQIDSDFSN
jgi:serine/threonine protein kinase